jgi:hypothetical protein
VDHVKATMLVQCPPLSRRHGQVLRPCPPFSFSFPSRRRELLRRRGEAEGADTRRLIPTEVRLAFLTFRGTLCQQERTHSSSHTMRWSRHIGTLR